MDKAAILEKIKKVQALAERGMPGERDHAAVLLEKLMEQHGITEQDLEAERVELVYFRYGTELEARLLGQIIYMIMGDCGVYIRYKNEKRPHKVKGVYCTAAERVEIELTFKFYREALNRDMMLVYRAFVSKNELFPPPDKKRVRSDDDEPEELSGDEKLRLAFLMEGLERHTMRPMLTEGGRDHV